MLKRLLSSLLGKFYSKKESLDVSALSAIRLADTVTLASNVSLSDWETYRYTMPFTGYVHADAQANNGDCSMTINLSGEAFCANLFTFPTQGGIGGKMVRANKGQTIQIAGTGTKVLELRAFPTYASYIVSQLGGG